MDETSQPLELLLTVSREGPRTLGAQIEDQLRAAIRAGRLAPGARVPSTRDLSRQLGISRRVAVDAYAQLAAEGYLALRQGARPRVAETAAPRRAGGAEATGTPGRAARGGGEAARTAGGAARGGAARGDAEIGAAGAPARGGAESPAAAIARLRYDFRPSVPDVSAFPRAAWLKALREAVNGIADADLAYGDPCGVDELRAALAEYLGRVRGVVAEPERVIVTSGYSQGLGIVCHALRRAGARTIAVEDPSNPEQAWIAARAQLEPRRLAVDAGGARVDELDADAVVLTPAHQHPTGVVLARERRTALAAHLRTIRAIAIEDDYDAEYRYDRAAVGALQGLDPERVVYAGSVSKTLAPALRLGWLVVPQHLHAAVAHEKKLADMGSARIEQLAFAHFLRRGELDRHLRRMRARYRSRRDTLIEALHAQLPEAAVKGIAAGLHATVELPHDYDERAIRAAADAHRIGLATLADYDTATPRPPTLVLGYAQQPEPAIRAGIQALARAIRT
jgi:GntR family transcriptional regulator / MocR family aminotransferase